MSETTNEYERALPDELLNAPVKFGLVAQGHIPTIDRMLTEGKDWDSIGKEIGWQPSTAKQHFERYDYARLQSTVATLTAENEGLRKLFDAQVKELNGLYEQLSALRQQSIAWLPGGDEPKWELSQFILAVIGKTVKLIHVEHGAVNRWSYVDDSLRCWQWSDVVKWCPLSSIPVPEQRDESR